MMHNRQLQRKTVHVNCGGEPLYLRQAANTARLGRERFASICHPKSKSRQNITSLTAATAVERKSYDPLFRAFYPWPKIIGPRILEESPATVFLDRIEDAVRELIAGRMEGPHPISQKV